MGSLLFKMKATNILEKFSNKTGVTKIKDDSIKINLNLSGVIKFNTNVAQNSSEKYLNLYGVTVI